MKKSIKALIVLLALGTLIVLCFYTINKNDSDNLLSGLWIAKGTIYSEIDNIENIEQTSEFAKKSTYYLVLNKDKTFYAIFGDTIDNGNYSFIDNDVIYLEFNNKENIGTRCNIIVENELQCNLYASKFEKNI